MSHKLERSHKLEHRIKKNTTQRNRRSNPVKGSIQRNAGWITISVHGTPFERGFAHGYLLHKELKRVRPILKYLVSTYYKTTLQEYLETCKSSIHHHLKNSEWAFVEQELRGICAGYKDKTKTTYIDYDILVGWNSYLSLAENYKHKDPDNMSRCSAFIATGSSTHDGKLLMAHNTHCNFASGFITNVAMYVYPENGDSAFMMQTAPGLVNSSTDWFITKCGIIGCETTIAQINYIPDFTVGVPYFLRIRKAMEQGRSLDDYVAMMMDRNAGDYACSWLFGDTRSSEIMRFEQGLKIHDIKRTTDGVFYGMNSAFSPELRALETTDTGFENPESRTGARNLRLEHLLEKKRLTIADAKRIISDHYDVAQSCEDMGPRTICKHNENPEDAHFSPSGATDGKVVDTKMAMKMSFEGIMGSSCGRVFRKRGCPDAVKKHGNWKSVVDDMPKHPWIRLQDHGSTRP